MPIHEIRESLEQSNVTFDTNGFAIVQKVINLKPNMSHKMLQCDAFLDNPFPEIDGTAYFELLLTPTPVIYTDMVIAGRPSRAPSAALENVLFKQTWEMERGAITYKEEFPNRFISARPTFTWYMPKLYVTLFIHTDPENEGGLNNLALSVYCAIESKKTSLVTYGMGLIREDHIAQVAAVMSNGRAIEPSRNVGQTYPMWKYGGVRPEYMMKSDAFADFFGRGGLNESQKTVDPNNLRGFAFLARKMVSNIEAFGTGGDVKGDIPDWIRMFLPEGIVSGAIRDQWPPTKHADNGNVLTL
jgi:hypothetical protein